MHDIIAEIIHIINNVLISYNKCRLFGILYTTLFYLCYDEHIRIMLA